MEHGGDVRGRTDKPLLFSPVSNFNFRLELTVERAQMRRDVETD